MKCLCSSKDVRASSSEREFKSVSDMDSENMNDASQCRHIDGKQKNCCKYELFIPSRILKLFQAERMTRLEKSKRSNIF